MFRKKSTHIDMNNIPAHIGIIMDGNGRWAKKRGLVRSAGHRAGAGTLKKISKECGRLGVKALTVYAFSTENWKRPKEEVDALMSLLLEYLKNAEKELGGDNARISVIGDRAPLSDEIKSEIIRVEQLTEKNDGINVVIALNYGGRDELINAFKAVAEDVKNGKIDIDDINEDLISNNVYTKDLPPVDLIIRPSGEYRLSNFLLWDSAYAEFWFSNILWPDFKERDLHKAIADYQHRSRRFGGV